MALRYRRTQQSKANVHVDQIVPLQKNTVYEVSAFVRWEGNLRPILAVARMDWKPLGLAVCQGGQQWTEVRLAFNSFENEQVRLEWFPGAEGKLYTSAPGSSYLDDVCLKAMPEVPESLRLAFQVIRPKSADEIAPAQRSAGPVGKPKPLRPIICRDGSCGMKMAAKWPVGRQSANGPLVGIQWPPQAFGSPLTGRGPQADHRGEPGPTRIDGNPGHSGASAAGGLYRPRRQPGRHRVSRRARPSDRPVPAAGDLRLHNAGQRHEDVLPPRIRSWRAKAAASGCSTRRS